MSQNNQQRMYSTPYGLSTRAPRPVDANRDPATTDLGYDPCTLWTSGTEIYGLAKNSGGTATWIQLGSTTSTGINTLTGSSGGAIAPVTENITLAAGTGMLSTAGSAGTITFNVNFASPPAIGTGTPAAATFTSLTAAGTVNLNASGAGVTTIGTGGTGATNIGNATGNTVVTGTLTADSLITSSASLGTTYTANSITPTGSNTNIDLLVNGKGTGGVIQSRGIVAGDLTIEVTNTDNTSGSSRAGFEAAVGGASSGDPYVNFLVSGAGVFTMGIDNSDSDNFVISANAALGTSNAMVLTSAGAATFASTVTSTAGNFVAGTAGTGILLNSPAASGAAASPVVVDGRSGRATFTSVSIAAAADLTLTLTNSSITAATTQIVFGWSGATTGSALSIKSVTPGAGTCAFVVTNGTGATTSTADIVIDFLVVNA